MALAAFPCCAGAPAAAAELNRIVLRVNDHIATLHDYEQRRASLVAELQRRELDPAERRRLLAEAPEAVLNEIFQELLLQSRADQLAVEVPEERVEDTLQRMKEGYGITNDDEFRQALAQSGMNEEQLRAQMRRNLRMREVMQREVQDRVLVSEEDLRRVYGRSPDRFRVPEQRRLREVVVLDTSGRSAEERQRIAEEVRQELGKGEPVPELVAGYAAQGVTSNVIDLGWVNAGDLDADIEAAARALQAGEVSPPVSGRGGLHLVHLLEVRPPRVPSFAEVEEQLRQQEEERVYREEIGKYMQELQETSFIVAKPPAEAAGFRRRLGEGLPEEVLEGGAPAAPAPGAAPEEVPEEIPPIGKPDPGDPGQLPVPKPIDPQPPDEPPFQT
ncbi:MAG TPA: peptidyl-prolyl cis-trans isomerase [Thermoanaerobaculia bacterium]|nr:peptidyl-prolyl cis-trans isomerase [Thermoanaerobaculia bacterium]